MSAVRPLALIALLAGALFALKALAFADGASLFFESRAEAREIAAGQEAGTGDAETPAASEPVPETVTPMPSQSAGGLAEPETASHAQLLTALAERRRALDAREAELDTREGLIEVAEQRVEERIARLETLRGEVEALLGQLETERQDEVNSLVATYRSLEPEAAARILISLDEMDPDTLLMVSRELQNSFGRNFAAIMGEMAEIDPAFAARLTSRLRAQAMPPQTVAELEAGFDAAAH
ncbi:hypothetical protein E5163_02490 [Marinicauda algicola]|uniref:Uncharacterized protein n=1 Tax=Marinicauda algicola TaxID=2029849 RepID=A0A4V3RYE6_9PROT|nr:hypothetical protein [Marinicauda algicola]TGY90019.1 hypothetical protein E5163_02490 [Marinicauda algicola]